MTDMPQLEIASVAANVDSAKVAVTAFPGALDYRIYIVGSETVVKYAGMNYAASPTVPMTAIELNGLTPGVAVEAVVEAVDALGPVPAANLYDDNNAPITPPMAGMPSMLGSNEGPTLDGNTSVNGQGPTTNKPNVIARSLPFMITPNAAPPIPSGADAEQTLFDTFESGVVTPGAISPATSDAAYTLATPSNKWDIQAHNVDVKNTKPFVMSRHYMDVAFDGGTPGSNNPLHVGHGVIALTADKVFDISGGKVAHFTFEADGRTDARRWVAINIFPASDPAINFDEGVADTGSPSGAVNVSNTAFFLQILNDHYATNLYGKNADGTFANKPITGSLGQAPKWAPRGNPWGKEPNGPCLDYRDRYDLFISQSHFQVYENGVLIVDMDIPGGLPFSDLKAYWSHYIYHSALELQEVAAGAPYETFWLNVMKYSDERHWDNLGGEVLPATVAWTSLASRVVMPVAAPPVYVSAPPPPTPPAPPAPPSPPTPPTPPTPTPPAPLTATGVPSKVACMDGTISVTVNGITASNTDDCCASTASSALAVGRQVTITYDADTLKLHGVELAD